MPIQHAIWKVEDNPQPLSASQLASEQKLEEMIVRDSRIRSGEWMLIGRQEIASYGNDEHTLRSSGSKFDPYAVFHKMLDRGNPPDDWAALLAASCADVNQNF